MDYSTNKQYNNLLNKLPEDTELHPLNKDFIDKEYLNNNYNYILFEYTTDFPEIIQLLNKNNIEYIIKKDSYNLEYILIK
tara:strand:+ start:158 stop:397 length:240 start_codon:yes stop_codon:yes gene_type:complete